MYRVNNYDVGREDGPFKLRPILLVGSGFTIQG